MADEEFKYDLRKIISFPGFNVIPKADVKEVTFSENLEQGAYIFYILHITPMFFDISQKYSIIPYIQCHIFKNANGSSMS